MGGIAGLLSLTRARADSKRVEQMLSALRPRGPDDQGLRRALSGRLVMGGCRTVLGDADGETQFPLVNEAGDVWAVIDGEVDNHRTLRHSLGLDGHQFRSEGSAEVVVHAYEQYGASFLDHLHGRFALALWDEPRQRLLLARDRLGERPLYWTSQGGLFAFASQARTLLDVLPLPRRLDLEVLPEYLAHGFVMPPRTLLDGIRKLGPGEALAIERGGRQMVPITWWTPCRDERRAAAVRALPAETHETNLRVLVDSAIADRLTTHRSICAVIDGEPESLALAAGMARLLGRSIDGLVLGEAERFETPLSAAGVRLVPVHPSEAQMVASIGDCLDAMDEPIADPEVVGQWWLARAMANAGLSVGLAATGAGTALLGPELLARHRRAPFAWRLLRRLGPTGRRAGAGLLAPLLSLSGHGDGAQALRRAADGEPPLPSPATLFADPATLLPVELQPLVAAHPPAEAVARLRRQLPPWIAQDELGSLAVIELRMGLAERRLMALDRMSMAHSVELRHPFLDDALIDYALAVPSPQRVPGGRPKDLLLRALRGLLPVAALPPARPAPPPLARWLRRPELGAMVERSFTQGGLVRQGLFDSETCRTLLAEHQIGRDHHAQLWALYVLIEWANRLGLEVSGLLPQSEERPAAVG